MKIDTTKACKLHIELRGTPTVLKGTVGSVYNTLVSIKKDKQPFVILESSSYETGFVELMNLLLVYLDVDTAIYFESLKECEKDEVN